MRSGAYSGTASADGETIMDIFMKKGHYHGILMLKEIGWETHKTFLWNLHEPTDDKKRDFIRPEVKAAWERQTTQVYCRSLASEIHDTPMSLMRQSRKNILTMLQSRVQSKIRYLPLPTYLLNFLRLPELDFYLEDFVRFSIDNISEIFPYVQTQTKTENIF